MHARCYAKFLFVPKIEGQKFKQQKDTHASGQEENQESAEEALFSFCTFSYCLSSANMHMCFYFYFYLF